MRNRGKQPLSSSATNKVIQAAPQLSQALLAEAIGRVSLQFGEDRSENLLKMASQLIDILNQQGFGLEPLPEQSPSSRPASVPSRYESHRNLVDSNEQHDPKACLKRGGDALKRSDMLLACDHLSRGCDLLQTPSRFADHDPQVESKLKQQLALAYAEVGLVDKSRQLLDELDSQTSAEPETQGIFGRIFKSMALRSKDEPTRLWLFSEAFQRYHGAYQISNDSYNGINSATLSLLSGNRKRSAKIARDVLRQCLEQYQKSPSDPWLNATLGEAYLLIEELNRAEQHYKVANRLMRGEYRNQRSMQRQAQLIAGIIGLDGSFIGRCFSKVNIAIFTGHMIDHKPGFCRFPAEREAEVRQLIRDHILSEELEVGYCSAAAGADIIFIEQMLALDKEVHVLLPYETGAFEQTSVDLYTHSRWVERFHTVLDQAHSVTVLCDYDARVEESLLEFSSLYAHGVARDRASRINGNVKGLAVWDGCSSEARGGTYQTLSHWREEGTTVVHIDISAYSALPNKRAIVRDVACTLPAGMTHYSYAPMLFADIKGYSQLSDMELTIFTGAFLQLVADICASHQSAITSKRVVGDGLFIVFKQLEDAAQVAAKIRDGVSAHDWFKDGLGGQMSIRLSLDAGPIYSFYDPVDERQGFFGGYVNRAARMEPITPPGKVFVSDTFVALCRALSREIDVTYVGKIELAKQHGRVRAYLLR